MARRVTLANSVNSSIPICNTKVEKLPKGVSMAIEKLQRNFIRKHEESSRKVHFVHLETIYQPKQFGELVVRRFGKMNTACLMKL